MFRNFPEARMVPAVLLLVYTQAARLCVHFCALLERWSELQASASAEMFQRPIDPLTGAPLYPGRFA
jgi:hypothetical protein